MQAQVSTHSAHQTTKDRCRIFHVGLDSREVMVVESVFRANPELGARYIFGAPEAGDVADIVFVNGDDDGAIAGWQQLNSKHPTTVPIYVTAHPERFPGAHHVRKPLGFRNFMSVIDSITSAVGSMVQPAREEVPDPLRILIVDDSFPARQFIQFKLEELADSSMALSIHSADSGELALHEVQSIPFDVVFLDVVMPGMDGYEVCRKIKAIRPTRVALLTGLNASVDFARGREVGCDNYLTKPPNDADLSSILRLVALKKEMAKH